MIHPLIIYDTDQDHPLYFSQLVRSDLLFFGFIEICKVLVKACFQALGVHVSQRFFIKYQIFKGRCDLFQSFVQAFEIPFFRIFRSHHDRIGHIVDQFMGHSFQIFRKILTEQYFFTFSVYDLTLLVHNVIVLQYVFTNGEVLAFHFLLCIFDLPRHHTGFDRFIFFHTKTLYDRLHPVAAKQTHQIVFHGNAELGLARVSLSSGTTSQLVVDTS